MRTEHQKQTPEEGKNDSLPGLTSACNLPCKSFEGYRGNARHGFILRSVFAMDSPVCAAYPFAANYGTSKDESTLRGGMVLSNESKRLVQGDRILPTIEKREERKKMKRYA